MRIGCLQFAPQVGDVENNLNRADAVLSRLDPMDVENLDLLVLPEMAFSGYNFKSLEEITPFVEPSGSGISSLWARTTALKYDCTVAVGYPERDRQKPVGRDYYNSLIVVNGDGETVANYRKSSLYYTDETWASEGDGFYQGEIRGLGKVAMGICMDINPYKFEAPWTAFEFGFHVLQVKANLVIISMAWLTHEDARTFTRFAQEPDMETLTYWIQRLEPVIRAENEEEVIVVFANRCGIEGDTVYAGTSAVLGIQNGEVSVYGLLGRGTKEVLIVDTELPPFAKLVNRPDASGETDEEVSGGDRTGQAARSGAAPAEENFKSPYGQKSPLPQLPSFPERIARTGNEEQGDNTAEENGYFKSPNYASGRGPPVPRESPSPRENRSAYRVRDQPSPREIAGYGRTASPRDGSSPKASPTFRQAASSRDNYSPRFPTTREEHGPRRASPRDGYFPAGASSRDGHSPGLASQRRANSPRIPSPRDFYTQGVPSPREWYGLAHDPAPGPQHPVSSGRIQAPVGGQTWDDEGLPELASPTFPEPTPMSARPKLAISTGPETLPPMPRRGPPPGVQPGNFFSSRDLCTPPETPFEDVAQPFTQQPWVPPSAFTYTPEEPEWPETGAGTASRHQAPGRRPSPANAPSNKVDFTRTQGRTVPTRPASRTQEVKLSDLDDARHQDQDRNSRHTSKSRNPSRVGAPDTRTTPAVGERSTPRPRTKRSESFTNAQVPASRNGASGVDEFQQDDRRTETRGVPGPVQSVRDSIFPWNSITIAASPSVFKTQFARSETFPRTDAHKAEPRTAAGRDAGGRLKRSKSISAFKHDPTNYLPSPVLPVHKAYQDMIYSAIEPTVSIDKMWEAAAAAADSPLSKRHGSISSERGAAMPLEGLVRPDILSPMSV